MRTLLQLPKLNVPILPDRQRTILDSETHLDVLQIFCLRKVGPSDLVRPRFVTHRHTLENAFFDNE
jgi:hypothetical protein